MPWGANRRASTVPAATPPGLQVVPPAQTMPSLARSGGDGSGALASPAGAHRAATGWQGGVRERALGRPSTARQSNRSACDGSLPPPVLPWLSFPPAPQGGAAGWGLPPRLNLPPSLPPSSRPPTALKPPSPDTSTLQCGCLPCTRSTSTGRCAAVDSSARTASGQSCSHTATSRSSRHAAPLPASLPAPLRSASPTCRMHLRRKRRTDGDKGEMPHVRQARVRTPKCCRPLRSAACTCARTEREGRHVACTARRAKHALGSGSG